MHEAYEEQERQQHALDDQAQHQLYVQCIGKPNNEAPAQTVQRVLEFFGPGCGLPGWRPSWFVTGAWLLPQRQSGGIQPQHYTSAAAAVVEFSNKAAAAAVLGQRQQVLFFNQGKATKQLALEASGIGYLKSCSCLSCRGRIGRRCTCPKYCKVFRNTRRWFRQEAAASSGSKELPGFRLREVQLGCWGPADPLAAVSSSSSTISSSSSGGGGSGAHGSGTRTNTTNTGSSCMVVEACASATAGFPSAGSKVTFDLQERCVKIELQLGDVATAACDSVSSLDGATGHEWFFDDTSTYMLQLPFRDVLRSIQVDRQAGSLTLTTRKPPRVLRAIEARHDADVLGLDVPEWALACDATAPYGLRDIHEDLRRLQAQGMGELTAEALGELTAVLESSCAGCHGQLVGSGCAGADGLLGRCWTYRLFVNRDDGQELAPDSQLMRKLASYRLLAPSRSRHNQQQQQQRRAAGQLPAPTALLSSPSRELQELLQALEYTVGYWVLVLLSAGIITTWQAIHPSFAQPLRTSPALFSVQALAELQQWGSRHMPYAAEVLQQLLAEVAASMGPASAASAQAATDAEAAADERLFKVLRVHVTPTRLKHLPPEVQTGHRVIRHFASPDHAHMVYPEGPLHCLSRLPFTAAHFLRVSFGDEAGDRLNTSREEPIDAFWRRMTRVLKQGVVVNGRHFTFLAYSSSQLKTWSCWMVADPHQRSGPGAPSGAAAIAEALRSWMGDVLDKVHVPAKAAARLGQCFSTTVDAAAVSPGQLATWPDVERNGYVFSDGVGCISPGLLEEVLSAVQPDRLPEEPPVCAIQVRLQGCKGVLCRNSSLTGRSLSVRPSMEKFTSSHPALEVCATAAWLPAYLNRQVIIMMAHNGVPKQVFMDKLEGMLDSLAAMCKDASTAAHLLPRLGGIEPTTQRALACLLEVAAAWGVRSGPLLDSCLRAVARWQVTDLRNKARLLVPDGAMLVGVMDEHGVLDEGEVFVQVQPRRTGGGNGTSSTPGSSSSSVASTIITGRVLLAKHPVAHMGDVRVVTAVDPRTRPRGSRLVDDCVNLVVFSQRGDRPLPNMLSGSDLDGDQYSVVWHQELLQPRNAEPLDYAAEKPTEVDRVTVDHIQEHFVSFAKNDNLGMIAVNLLAHADRDGADCDACQELAMLHSMAVDFGKTGKPAVVPPNLNPQAWPHWMGKPEQRSYHSTTVLGAMYDRVCEHPVTTDLIDRQLLAAGGALGEAEQQRQFVQEQQAAEVTAAAWAERLVGCSWLGAVRELRPEVQAAFAAFEGELQSLMNTWGVFDVGEFLTACLPRLQARQRGQHHHQSEQRDRLTHELRRVWGSARRAFLLLALGQPAAQAAAVAAQAAAGQQQLNAIGASSAMRGGAGITSSSGSGGTSGAWAGIDAEQLASMTLKELELQLHHLRHARRTAVSAGAAAACDAVTAAYVLEAHRHARRRLRQQQQQQQQGRGLAATTAAAASFGTLGGSNDTDDDSDEDAYDPEGWPSDSSEDEDAMPVTGGAGPASALPPPQQGISRAQQQEELVRLSFALVAARELRALGLSLNDAGAAPS